MRNEKTDMLKAMEESPLVNYLTAALIENADSIFNVCVFVLFFFLCFVFFLFSFEINCSLDARFGDL